MTIALSDCDSYDENDIDEKFIKYLSYSASSSSFSILLIFASQVPSLPANFGVKKLLSGEPASPLVNDTMSMASGYSTVTGTVIGPSVIARLPFFLIYFLFLLALPYYIFTCQCLIVDESVYNNVLSPDPLLSQKFL